MNNLIIGSNAISTDLMHPSLPKTLGELRLITTNMPDETPLRIDGRSGDYPAPALYLETDDNSLIFTDPWED